MRDHKNQQFNIIHSSSESEAKTQKNCIMMVCICTCCEDVIKFEALLEKSEQRRESEMSQEVQRKLTTS